MSTVLPFGLFVFNLVEIWNEVSLLSVLRSFQISRRYVANEGQKQSSYHFKTITTEISIDSPSNLLIASPIHLKIDVQLDFGSCVQPESFTPLNDVQP